MGYCDEGCDHLTRRHNCNKYHKGLTYFGYSSKSLAYGSHERCSECDKDHYIAELEEKNNMSWIPVSERLPEDDGMYIACFDDDFITAVMYITDRQGAQDWELWADSGDVVAWMPLPEPYRPE